MRISRDTSRNAMKSIFDYKFGAKEYRRFLHNYRTSNKLDKFKYVGKQGLKAFSKSILGENITQAIRNIDWKNPKVPTDSTNS